MNENMGQILRRLRRERGMTQEELAEQLGVTFQAVSKWENGTGRPDLSQVVPLARLFGVSTDVLFGLAGTNDRERVRGIIEDAQRRLSQPLGAAGLLEKYRALQAGLEQYPNSTALLAECLEAGLALSYPESEVYDAKNGKAICRDCVRYANLIISYSPKAGEVMRAHMAMVMLHSAYGNFSEALTHIAQFSPRADFNIHVMYAYFAHWRKEYDREIGSCQYAILHYLDGMLTSAARLAGAFVRTGRYPAAEETLETALSVIGAVFRDDAVRPPVHYREQGDLYLLLADAYLKDGKREKALDCLEKMAEYDTDEYPKVGDDTRTVSPFLGAVAHEPYIRRIDRAEALASKLADTRLDALREDYRFRRLLERVEGI